MKGGFGSGVAGSLGTLFGPFCFVDRRNVLASHLDLKVDFEALLTSIDGKCNLNVPRAHSNEAKGYNLQKTSTNIVSKRVRSPHKIELSKGCVLCSRCFVLRFSRKAKSAPKVLRVDPTIVSLPLDARRTK